MLSVFKFYKGWYKFPSSIFQHIKNFFKKIKFAYQRITKGYCDYDLYELDQYYKKLMYSTLIDFAKNTNSYPRQFNSMKDWQIVLQNAANQFRQSFIDKPNLYQMQLIEMSKQDRFEETEQFQKLCDLSIDQNVRDQKIKRLHFAKGLDFIKKYNKDLWD